MISVYNFNGIINLKKSLKMVSKIYYIICEKKKKCKVYLSSLYWEGTVMVNNN